MSYAESTTVPFERSVSEIVAMLKRAGAMQIGQMDDAASYAIQFKLADRLIRFRLPLPSLDDMPTQNGRKQALTATQRGDRLEQANRSRARALMLVIKAKLESVECGIETIEQAFLANVVMADGASVYDRVSPRIAIEYQTGRPDPLAGLLEGPSA